MQRSKGGNHPRFPGILIAAEEVGLVIGNLNNLVSIGLGLVLPRAAEYQLMRMVQWSG